MSEDPEWFAAKRYGYGASLPISWQGWAATLLYIGTVVATGSLFKDRPLVIVAIVIPATVALLAIASRTTRGGWRWRWGERD